MHSEFVPTLTRMLTNIDGWIDKAIEHATTKKFDPNVLLTARLAPDQFHLLRQLQAACDHAKFAAARTAGKDPPKHPDDQKSFDEIRARIRDVREYIAGFRPEDFAGAETRIVPLAFIQGKGMLATDYLRAMAMPNFWFHTTTAYAILRHNGVNLGKRDFIGDIPLKDL